MGDENLQRVKAIANRVFLNSYFLVPEVSRVFAKGDDVYVVMTYRISEGLAGGGRYAQMEMAGKVVAAPALIREQAYSLADVLRAYEHNRDPHGDRLELRSKFNKAEARDLIRGRYEQHLEQKRRDTVLEGAPTVRSFLEGKQAEAWANGTEYTAVYLGVELYDRLCQETKQVEHWYKGPPIRIAGINIYGSLMQNPDGYHFVEKGNEAA